MKIRHILEGLNEAPIGDFKTIGNFDNSHSMRDPKDRKMVSNPAAQEIYRKKFGKTDQTFNLYFVNQKGAAKYAETGEVSLEWIESNLGDEVSSVVSKDNDAINVIFTNNTGDQRVNMTPWIVAHRMAHALTRGTKKNYLNIAYGDFIRQMGTEVFPNYKIDNFPKTLSGFTRDPQAQKILQLFMYEAGTFKSARDKKLRNGYEALHELFAQYIITGDVVSAKTPITFGNRNFRASLGNDIQDFEMVEYDHVVDYAFNTLYWGIDQALGSFAGKYFVM